MNRMNRVLSVLDITLHLKFKPNFQLLRNGARSKTCALQKMRAPKNARSKKCALQNHHKLKNGAKIQIGQCVKKEGCVLYEILILPHGPFPHQCG